jgi:hypothetical protein
MMKGSPVASLGTVLRMNSPPASAQTQFGGRRDSDSMISTARPTCPSRPDQYRSKLLSRIRLPFLGICVDPISRVSGDILPQRDAKAIRMVVNDLSCEKCQNTLEFPVSHDFSAA